MRRTRREMLTSAGSALLVAGAGAAPAFARAADATALPQKLDPLPLTAIKLAPSDYATAVQVNQRYLLRLDPDRLLHNFRLYAGLQPKGALYGGWESDTIAG